MAIEIDVVPNFAQSEVAGVLLGSVIISSTARLRPCSSVSCFKDRADQVANEEAAINAAKQLALRLIQDRAA
jgi:hypothetical protein